MIRLKPGARSSANIVTDARVIPGTQGRLPQLTFSLTGVSAGPQLVLGRSQQVWNQTLVNLKVSKTGNGLGVAASFKGPCSHVKVAFADKHYIGISLVGTPKSLPAVNEHTTIPAWFLRDLLVANRLQYTPVQLATYGQPLPIKTSGPHELLSAPYHGTLEALGYGSYFGKIRIGDLYANLDSGKVDGLLGLRTGKVAEQVNGRQVQVPAVILGMPNAWSLGFAENQVIIASEHSGFIQYSVYTAPRITIPSAAKSP